MKSRSVPPIHSLPNNFGYLVKESKRNIIQVHPSLASLFLPPITVQANRPNPCAKRSTPFSIMKTTLDDIPLDVDISWSIGKGDSCSHKIPSAPYIKKKKKKKKKKKRNKKTKPKLHPAEQNQEKGYARENGGIYQINFPPDTTSRVSEKNNNRRNEQHDLKMKRKTE